MAKLAQRQRASQSCKSQTTKSTSSQVSASSSSGTVRVARRSANSGGKGAQKRASNASSVSTDDESCLGSSEFTGLVLRQHEVVPEDAPPEIKLVREYLRHKDNNRLEEMQEMSADACMFNFVDAEALMLSKEFYGAMAETFASFPDLRFHWSSMRIAGTDRVSDGVKVVVKDYYGIGTHTGHLTGSARSNRSPRRGPSSKTRRSSSRSSSRTARSRAPRSTPSDGPLDRPGST